MGSMADVKENGWQNLDEVADYMCHVCVNHPISIWQHLKNYITNTLSNYFLSMRGSFAIWYVLG